MGEPVSDLAAMLSAMEPVLFDAPYEFRQRSSDEELAQQSSRIFALIHEDEGTTLVLHSDDHESGDLFARITLQVHSSLSGVGLTAAVSSALAKIGIACNVIAAFHHDHIFVPWSRREEAMAALTVLQASAQ